MRKSLLTIVLAGSLGVLAVGAGVAVGQRSAGPVVEVYKTPTCGCCGKWVEHLRAEGFTVRVTDMPDLSRVKSSNGIPASLQSCHTAVVGGYVVEGHVPAQDVKRVLATRPAIAGVAVAGMPIGSPGMEVAGVAPQPYDVMAFDARGTTSVFASHNR